MNNQGFPPGMPPGMPPNYPMMNAAIPAQQGQMYNMQPQMAMPNAMLPQMPPPPTMVPPPGMSTMMGGASYPGPVPLPPVPAPVPAPQYMPQYQQQSYPVQPPGYISQPAPQPVPPPVAYPSYTPSPTASYVPPPASQTYIPTPVDSLSTALSGQQSDISAALAKTWANKTTLSSSITSYEDPSTSEFTVVSNKRKYESGQSHLDGKRSKLNDKNSTEESSGVDPEYVQSQVFIGNLPHDTTSNMISEIMEHYKLEMHVFMAEHEKDKKKVCAFVKFPSLSDSKRVIGEMKGFPYKKQEMDIRFTAASDFIDYQVRSESTKTKPSTSSSKHTKTSSSRRSRSLSPSRQKSRDNLDTPKRSSQTHSSSSSRAKKRSRSPRHSRGQGRQKSLEPDKGWDYYSTVSSEGYGGPPPKRSDLTKSRSPARRSPVRRSPERRFSDRRSPAKRYSDRKSSPSRRSPHSCDLNQSGLRDISPEPMAQYSPDAYSRQPSSPGGGYGNTDGAARKLSDSCFAVYLGNLPTDISDMDLENFIQDYPYEAVHMKVRYGRGFAHVYFLSYVDADMMVLELNGRMCRGNRVVVEHETNPSGPTPHFATSAECVDPDGRQPQSDMVAYPEQQAVYLIPIQPSLMAPDMSTQRETEKTLFQSFIDASYTGVPVLGQKYIIEYKSEDNSTAHYVCILCEVTCSWKTIADHMMGYKHRLKCMKRSHPKAYEKLCLIRDKVEMLEDCSKCAAKCVNNNERIKIVRANNPEKDACDWLHKMKEKMKAQLNKNSEGQESDDRKPKKAQTSRTESSRSEKSRTETSRSEKSRTETSRSDKSRTETSRSDKSKSETSKSKSSRRAESSRSTSKQSPRRADSSKSSGKQSTSKTSSSGDSSTLDIFKRIEAYKKKFNAVAEKDEVETESKKRKVEEEPKSPTKSPVSAYKIPKAAAVIRRSRALSGQDRSKPNDTSKSSDSSKSDKDKTPNKADKKDNNKSDTSSGNNRRDSSRSQNRQDNKNSGSELGDKSKSSVTSSKSKPGSSSDKKQDGSGSKKKDDTINRSSKGGKDKKGEHTKQTSVHVHTGNKDKSGACDRDAHKKSNDSKDNDGAEKSGDTSIQQQSGDFLELTSGALVPVPNENPASSQQPLSGDFLEITGGSTSGAFAQIPVVGSSPSKPFTRKTFPGLMKDFKAKAASSNIVLIGKAAKKVPKARGEDAEVGKDGGNHEKKRHKSVGEKASTGLETDKVGASKDTDLLGEDFFGEGLNDMDEMDEDADVNKETGADDVGNSSEKKAALGSGASGSLDFPEMFTQSFFSNHRNSVLYKCFNLYFKSGSSKPIFIGMQYITEILPSRRNFLYKYFCNLCVLQCDNNSVAPHVLGFKHRMQYLKLHCKDKYDELMLKDPSPNVMKAESFKLALDLKRLEDRQPVVSILDTEESDMWNKKRKTKGVVKIEPILKPSDTEADPGPTSSNSTQQASMVSKKADNDGQKQASSLGNKAGQKQAPTSSSKAGNDGQTLANDCLVSVKVEPEDMPEVKQEVIDVKVEQPPEPIKVSSPEPSEPKAPVVKPAAASGKAPTLAQKIERAKKHAVFVKQTDTDHNMVKMYQYLRQKPDVPILGLNYVTEMIHINSAISSCPMYLCGLCLSHTKTDGCTNMYKHIVGAKHLENYLAKHYPHKIQPLKLLTKGSDRSKYLLNQAKVIAETLPTQCIKFVDLVELDKAEKAAAAQVQVKSDKAKLEKDVAAEVQARYEETSSSGTIQPRTNVALDGSGGLGAADSMEDGLDVDPSTITAHLYTLVKGLHAEPIVDVWMLGDSIMHLAGQRAIEKQTPNLKLPNITIRWWGVRGMGWSQFAQQVQYHLLFNAPPKAVVIHLGGNDLNTLSHYKLHKKIKQGIKYLKSLFQDSVIVWVDVLQRRTWCADGATMERKRCRVNRLGRQVVKGVGGQCVAVDIDFKTAGFYRLDGVHLSLIGLERFLDTLRDALLRMGLGSITEHQTTTGTFSQIVRYACKTCGVDQIEKLYINSHLTSHEHRMKFLQLNYPVLHSKSEGKKDLVENYCREIESQFGRESIRVIQHRGPNIFTKPVIVKAPYSCKLEADQDLLETLDDMDDFNTADVSESEDKPHDVEDWSIVLYKILRGLDYTPMLGLMYITEIQHPEQHVSPVYECEICGHMKKNYLTTKNILKHICSRSHKMNFFRENHYHLYQEVISEKAKNRQNEMLVKYTKDIESKVGRGSVQKKVSADPVYWGNRELSATGNKSAEPSTIKKELSTVDSVVRVKNTLRPAQQGRGPVIKKSKNRKDGPARYMCRHCGLVMEIKRMAANLHIQNKHANPYICQECGFKCMAHKTLVDHYDNKHGLIVAVNMVDTSFAGSFEVVFCKRTDVYMYLGDDAAQNVGTAVVKRPSDKAVKSSNLLPAAPQAISAAGSSEPTQLSIVPQKETISQHITPAVSTPKLPPVQQTPHDNVSTKPQNVLTSPFSLPDDAPTHTKQCPTNESSSATSGSAQQTTLTTLHSPASTQASRLTGMQQGKSPTVGTKILIKIDDIVSVVSDPAFNWDTEFDKILEKIQFGGMIESARKSKFIIAYTADGATFPLLGLEYIREYQKQNIRQPAFYMCNLCKEQATLQNIAEHISSLKHRILFMKSNFNHSYYGPLTRAKFYEMADLSKMVDVYSEKIAFKLRAPNVVQVMVELPHCDTVVAKAKSALQEGKEVAKAVSLAGSNGTQKGPKTTSTSSSAGTSSSKDTQKHTEAKSAASTRVTAADTKKADAAQSGGLRQGASGSTKPSTATTTPRTEEDTAVKKSTNIQVVGQASLKRPEVKQTSSKTVNVVIEIDSSDDDGEEDQNKTDSKSTPVKPTTPATKHAAISAVVSSKPTVVSAKDATKPTVVSIKDAAKPTVVSAKDAAKPAVVSAKSTETAPKDSSKLANVSIQDTKSTVVATKSTAKQTVSSAQSTVTSTRDTAVPSIKSVKSTLTASTEAVKSATAAAKTSETSVKSATAALTADSSAKPADGVETAKPTEPSSTTSTKESTAPSKGSARRETRWSPAEEAQPGDSKQPEPSVASTASDSSKKTTKASATTRDGKRCSSTRSTSRRHDRSRSPHSKRRRTRSRSRSRHRNSRDRNTPRNERRGRYPANPWVCEDQEYKITSIKSTLAATIVIESDSGSDLESSTDKTTVKTGTVKQDDKDNLTSGDQSKEPDNESKPCTVDVNKVEKEEEKVEEVMLETVDNKGDGTIVKEESVEVKDNKETVVTGSSVGSEEFDTFIMDELGEGFVTVDDIEEQNAAVENVTGLEDVSGDEGDTIEIKEAENMTGLENVSGNEGIETEATENVTDLEDVSGDENLSGLENVSDDEIEIKDLETSKADSVKDSKTVVKQTKSTTRKESKSAPTKESKPTAKKESKSTPKKESKSTPKKESKPTTKKKSEVSERMSTRRSPRSRRTVVDTEENEQSATEAVDLKSADKVSETATNNKSTKKVKSPGNSRVKKTTKKKPAAESPSPTKAIGVATRTRRSAAVNKAETAVEAERDNKNTNKIVVTNIEEASGNIQNTAEKADTESNEGEIMDFEMLGEDFITTDEIVDNVDDQQLTVETKEDGGRDTSEHDLVEETSALDLSLTESISNIFSPTLSADQSPLKSNKSMDKSVAVKPSDSQASTKKGIHTDEKIHNEVVDAETNIVSEMNTEVNDSGACPRDLLKKQTIDNELNEDQTESRSRNPSSYDSDSIESFILGDFVTVDEQDDDVIESTKDTEDEVNKMNSTISENEGNESVSRPEIPGYAVGELVVGIDSESNVENRDKATASENIEVRIQDDENANNNASSMSTISETSIRETVAITYSDKKTILSDSELEMDQENEMDSEKLSEEVNAIPKEINVDTEGIEQNADDPKRFDGTPDQGFLVVDELDKSIEQGNEATEENVGEVSAEAAVVDDTSEAVERDDGEEDEVYDEDMDFTVIDEDDSEDGQDFAMVTVDTVSEDNADDNEEGEDDIDDSFFGEDFVTVDDADNENIGDEATASTSKQSDDGEADGEMDIDVEIKEVSGHTRHTRALPRGHLRGQGHQRGSWSRGGSWSDRGGDKSRFKQGPPSRGFGRGRGKFFVYNPAPTVNKNKKPFNKTQNLKLRTQAERTFTDDRRVGRGGASFTDHRTSPNVEPAGRRQFSQQSPSNVVGGSHSRGRIVSRGSGRGNFTSPKASTSFSKKDHSPEDRGNYSKSRASNFGGRGSNLRVTVGNVRGRGSSRGTRESSPDSRRSNTRGRGVHSSSRGGNSGRPRGDTWRDRGIVVRGNNRGRGGFFGRGTGQRGRRNTGRGECKIHIEID